METDLFDVETDQLFSKSKVWQLNREFYQSKGINAFSEGEVPHHLTSNALVGKTYAGLIFGLIKDLGAKGKIKEKVYILELGAGHGRLAFHILIHLDLLYQSTSISLPPYCYVLSDIGEKNLSFFKDHHQFKPYFDRGALDICYFDAIGSKDLELRIANKTIHLHGLDQPLIAIANYFFDSIPNELFRIKDNKITSCTITLKSKKDPSMLDPVDLIKHLVLSHHTSSLPIPKYDNKIANEILEYYKKVVFDTYLYFPEKSIQCIDNLRAISNAGLVLLTMDKGYHEIHNLEKIPAPDIVNHGSYSIWVNYHALGKYCEKLGGKAIFPSSSNFHLELGALLFLKDTASFTNTLAAYEYHVNDFGPDDFNTIKHQTYQNAKKLNIKELIALIRLSVYDSTFFLTLLPQIKEISIAITYNERRRIAETLHKVWNMYFSISELEDMPYEIGGIFYDLGFYHDALSYFKHSINLHGDKEASYYNIALCYYQLREDKSFYKIVKKAKLDYPNNEFFVKLDNLDMS